VTKYRLLVPLVLFVGVVVLIVDNYLRVGTLFQLEDIFHHETLVVVFVVLSFVSFSRLKKHRVKEKPVGNQE